MLNHRIAIIIPSSVAANIAAPELAAKWVRKAKELFAETFDGFTATPATGGWMSEEHGLIEEAVVVVQSMTDEKGLLAGRGIVREFAVTLAAAMGQECVSVEIDNSLEFISTADETAGMTG
jgi:hypothetical protein